MPDTFEITYSPETENTPEYAAELHAGGGTTSRANLAFLVGLLGVSGLGFAYIFSDPGNPMETALEPFLLGLLSGILAIFLGQFLSQTVHKNAAKKALEKRNAILGPTKVSFAADGITKENSIGRSAISWAKVTGTLDISTGTSLILAHTEVLPIPDEALPEGLNREEALTRIAKWRGKDA